LAKSRDVAELNDDIIDITAEHSLRISSPLTAFSIEQMGGAVSRVGDDETAFNGRSAGFTYNIGASRRLVRDSPKSANGYRSSGPHYDRGTKAST
jgi:hypothetical protein